MPGWSIDEAAEKFDEIAHAVMRGEPQRIVAPDGRAVIVVSEREFLAAQASGRARAAAPNRSPSSSGPTAADTE